MLALLVSFALSAKSDAIGDFPGYTWATKCGGTGDDSASATAIGPNGVIYVAGYFSGSATFGSVQLVSSGPHDIFLAAYNPDGHISWATRAGGALESEARGIATDAAGNVFITGTFRDSVTFGSTTISGGHFGSIFVAKYNSSGELIWAKAAGGSFGAFGQACAVDKNGDAYVTGFFSGPASFWDGYSANSIGFYAVFILKVSSDGHMVWLRTLGDGSSDNWGLGVAVDADFSTFAAGQIGRHFFIAKYDSIGNQQWLKQPAVQNVPGAAVPSPIPDGKGGAYFACNITGPSDFDGIPVTTTGGIDFVLGHYDSTGQPVWAKSFGGISDDYVRSIAQDVDGNLLAVGYFENSINFGPLTLDSSGGQDVLVGKFATDGAFIWAAQAGGANDDTALSVAADSSRNVSIVGSFSAAAAFGPSSLSSSGGADGFVAHLRAATVVPASSISYYVRKPDSTLLVLKGKQCAEAQVNGTSDRDAVVALLFGEPVKISATYGASLWGYPTSVNDIASLVQDFVIGYYNALQADRTAHVRIVVTTSNYGNNVTALHGAAWAQMVDDLALWVLAQGYSGQVDIAGGSNIEPDWNGAATTRAWVDGYASVAHRFMYNVGAASGCPGAGGLISGGCNHEWTQDDFWYVSWGSTPAEPLPEIYGLSNAKQWAAISLYGYLAHGEGMIFGGAMTEAGACAQHPKDSTCPSDSPQEGWQQLYDILNGDTRTAQTLSWSTDIQDLQ